MTDSADGLGGDMVVESAAKSGQVWVAVHAAELFCGFGHAGLPAGEPIAEEELFQRRKLRLRGCSSFRDMKAGSPLRRVPAGIVWLVEWGDQGEVDVFRADLR